MLYLNLLVRVTQGYHFCCMTCKACKYYLSVYKFLFLHNLELRPNIPSHQISHKDASSVPCLDDENVIQPDILFISLDRLAIIGEKNIQGAQDLAGEIISENSAYKDMIQKKRLYSRFGVKEYWVVIPDCEEIEIYILKDNTYRLYKSYNKSDNLESPLLKGLNIALKDIF